MILSGNVIFDEQGLAKFGGLSLHDLHIEKVKNAQSPSGQIPPPPPLPNMNRVEDISRRSLHCIPFLVLKKEYILRLNGPSHGAFYAIIAIKIQKQKAAEKWLSSDINTPRDSFNISTMCCSSHNAQCNTPNVFFFLLLKSFQIVEPSQTESRQ